MVCVGGGRPHIVYVWINTISTHLLQDSSLPGGEKEVVADVLRIANVTHDDSGTYQCTAVDGRGRQARRMVRVVVRGEGEGVAASASCNAAAGIFSLGIVYWQIKGSILRI